MSNKNRKSYHYNQAGKPIVVWAIFDETVAQERATDGVTKYIPYAERQIKSETYEDYEKQSDEKLGNPIILWWDWFSNHLVEVDIDSERLLKGGFEFKKNKIFQAEFHLFTTEEKDLWKIDPDCDVILLYTDLPTENGNTWCVRWKQVKQICFLDPIRAIGQFGFLFLRDRGGMNNDVMASLLNDTIYAKEPIVVQKSGGRQQNIQEIKFKKEMDKTEAEKIREELREYLGLKHKFKGKQLLEEVNKKKINFKGRWGQVKKALKPIGPRFYMPHSHLKERPFTVILPYEDDDDELHLHLLKCCAMYPVEMDPFSVYEGFEKDEDMLIQLAYSACGDGLMIGRHYLHIAAKQYKDLKLPFFTKEEHDIWNKPCRYFELATDSNLISIENERINNPKSNLKIKGEGSQSFWEKLQTIVEMDNF